MIIKTLVENTSISEEFTSDHGLCLYIETKKHKLMFDLGASALFVKNAKKMDVDLAAVDVVILSHGHYAPSHVIGGFHLYSRPRGKYEDTILINQIGEYLSNTGSKYYTCHCTGIEPYKILKDTMKEQITYLATGSQVII